MSEEQQIQDETPELQRRTMGVLSSPLVVGVSGTLAGSPRVQPLVPGGRTKVRIEKKVRKASPFLI